jgi:hypothetical protein
MLILKSILLIEYALTIVIVQGTFYGESAHHRVDDNVTRYRSVMLPICHCSVPR